MGNNDLKNAALKIDEINKIKGSDFSSILLDKR